MCWNRWFRKVNHSSFIHAILFAASPSPLTWTTQWMQRPSPPHSPPRMWSWRANRPSKWTSRRGTPRSPSPAPSSLPKRAKSQGTRMLLWVRALLHSLLLLLFFFIFFWLTLFIYLFFFWGTHYYSYYYYHLLLLFFFLRDFIFQKIGMINRVVTHSHFFLIESLDCCWLAADLDDAAHLLTWIYSRKFTHMKFTDFFFYLIFFLIFSFSLKFTPDVFSF